jgi:hypothetical protein
MFIQSPTHPHEVRLALEAAVTSQVQEVRLAVAYVTLSGVRLFAEMMAKHLGASWAQTRKQLVTCIDFGLTDPQALREWLSLGNASVFLHNTKIRDRRLRPTNAFHAKYYEFRDSAATKIVITSANLSKAALTANTEVALIETLTGDLGAADAAWTLLRQGAEKATPAAIDAYETRRSKIVVPIVSAAFPLWLPTQRLWDAISSGTAQPGNYNFFWVDAGSMSSGGSANQLEMPRGGHQFFGGSVNYSNKSKKILDVNISIDGQPLKRPLSWHGSNRMERLNLPTGRKYAQQVILFERVSSGYRVTARPNGSPDSQSWIDRSEAAGQRYKVGRSSTRQCGFF